MENNNDYDQLDDRLDKIESQLDNESLAMTGVITNRLNPPSTGADYYLSIIAIFKDNGDNVAHDETIVASSLEEAKRIQAQIQSRKTEYKRKIVIFQRGEETKNFSGFK